jgi:hypothetical protein
MVGLSLDFTVVDWLLLASVNKDLAACVQFQNAVAVFWRTAEDPYFFKPISFQVA